MPSLFGRIKGFFSKKAGTKPAQENKAPNHKPANRSKFRPVAMSPRPKGVTMRNNANVIGSKRGNWGYRPTKEQRLNNALMAAARKGQLYGNPDEEPNSRHAIPLTKKEASVYAKAHATNTRKNFRKVVKNALNSGNIDPVGYDKLLIKYNATYRNNNNNNNKNSYGWNEWAPPPKLKRSRSANEINRLSARELREKVESGELNEGSLSPNQLKTLVNSYRL